MVTTMEWLEVMKLQEEIKHLREENEMLREQIHLVDRRATLKVVRTVVRWLEATYGGEEE